MLTKILNELLANKVKLFHSHGYMKGMLKSYTKGSYSIESDTGKFYFNLTDVTACSITADTIVISLSL